MFTQVLWVVFSVAPCADGASASLKKTPQTPCLRVKFKSKRIRNILTKYSMKRRRKRLKTSRFNTLVSVLLSSSCKGDSQKVLNRASKGR